MEHEPKPQTVEDRVGWLERKVALLEQRLNNWVAGMAEREARKTRPATARAQAKLYPSKYNDVCKSCHQSITVGEPIHWTKVDGQSIAWHERCPPPAFV